MTAAKRPQSGLWVLQSHSGVQLQDAGRVGVAAAGLTQGGAIDLTAARLANALAGNHSDVSQNCAPVIEITLGAVAFRAEQPLLLAITGAAMPVLLNRQPVERYQTLYLQAGDLLEIGYSRAGARAYLAVAGGFQAPLVCGSVATVQREKVGGVDGRGQPVTAGSVLACAAYTGPQVLVSLPYQHHYQHRTIRLLSLVPGAQLESLPAATGALLAQRLFRVTPRSDRMGMQLGGEPLPVNAQTLYSEGICLGALQLPANGLPIVMLNDHQTIGGYPKAGALTRGSCEVLGQMMSGDLVRFQLVQASQAIAAERQRLRLLQQQLNDLQQQWQALSPEEKHDGDC